jgi:hypothetical protein
MGRAGRQNLASDDCMQGAEQLPQWNKIDIGQVNGGMQV